MLRYNIRTGVRKIKTKTVMAITGGSLGIAGLLMAIAMPLAAKAATSNNYSLFGDASIVQPGESSANALEATSTGTNQFGGASLNDPSGLTVSQLQTLSTDYMFKVGSCGLGSPRFSVAVTNGTTSGHIFFYLGPAPNYTGCPPNAWTPSGNLASATNLVDTSQLPGGTFYQPYANAQSIYGSYSITSVSLVVDGPNQTADFDNTQINDTTYNYEPVPTKDDCKNNGWKTMHDANNKSFKNQGDCVSYFATNGRNGGAGSSVQVVSTPIITSPANNSTLTSAQLTNIDWTDSTSANAPVTYQYRAYADATYTTLIYDSGQGLTNSNIPTPNTPNGVYYVQVQAKDSLGNLSAWSNDASNPFKITVSG